MNMTATFTGADVEATRKAAKMSRTKFAELVGLTPTKVGNIEKGRPMRPDEIAALTPHVAAGVAGPPPAEPNPVPDAGGDIIALNEELEDDAETWVDGEQGQLDLAPAPQFDMLFTNSEGRTFKRCRRKWWLAFYRRLGLPRPEVTGARSIGTRVHYALAAMYVPAGQTPGDPLAALDQTVREDLERLQSQPFPDPDEMNKFSSEVDLARTMVEGYLEWLAETGADQFIEVVAPETKLVVPLSDVVGPRGESVALLGKLDLRIRRTSDGARLFLDHKTVGSVTEPVRTLHMDEQMMHYHLLEFLDLLQRGAEAGERTDGGLYNMLRKVKRTARATPPFYDRVEVRHNIETLRSYYVRVVGEILDVLETKRKLDEGADHRAVAYPNPTKDCTWDCDFFHVCPMFDDGSRVEDFITENLITIDPHKRYDTDDNDKETT